MLRRDNSTLAAGRLDAEFWRLAAESKVRPLYLWGAGRAGRLVAEQAHRRGGQCSGFLISDPPPPGTVVEGLPVNAGPPVFPGTVRPFIAVTTMFSAEVEPLLAVAGWVRGEDYTVIPVNELIRARKEGS